MRTFTSSGLLALLLILPACGDDATSDDDPAGPGEPPGDTTGEPEPQPEPEPPPNGEWTFLKVDGMECMNDSSTGIGINPVAGSDKLLIFLEGGGACFNDLSCIQVAHPNGFTEEDLTGIVTGAKGVFDRDNPNNPFADYNFVFVPYCTGDIHAGVNPNGYGRRNQVGFLNMSAALAEMQSLFAPPTEVVLTGISAGGFGTIANYEQVREAFDSSIPVTLIDDSGPPLGNEVMTECYQNLQAEEWGLDQVLPADCPECRIANGGALQNILPYLAKKYPDDRFSIISTLEDGTIRYFIGFGYPDCEAPDLPMQEDVFREAVVKLRDEVVAPLENVSMYTLKGEEHGFLWSRMDRTEVNGVKLTDWLRAGLEGDPSWTNVAPPSDDDEQ